MNNEQGQAGTPAWPRLPREDVEVQPSRPITLPNAYTALLAVAWLGIVLFLPPSVVYDRNPPPSDLVPTWWVRFVACLGLVLFDLILLYFLRKGRAAGRIGARIVHLVTAGWAILIGAGLFYWVYEYPYPFGLPADFFK